MENSSLGTGREIAISWWPQNINDEKSTLVQITLPNVELDLRQHIASLGLYELIIALICAREKRAKVWSGMLSLMTVKMTVLSRIMKCIS